MESDTEAGSSLRYLWPLGARKKKTAGIVFANSKIFAERFLAFFRICFKRVRKVCLTAKYVADLAVGKGDPLFFRGAIWWRGWHSDHHHVRFSNAGVFSLQMLLNHEGWSFRIIMFTYKGTDSYRLIGICCYLFGSCRNNVTVGKYG